MIQPVIVEVASQRAAVRKLVEFCKKLDGTVIKVIPLTPADDAAFIPEHSANEKACRAAFSLRHAALAMKGQPFIWLEHDSIPLRKGWADILTSEYRRLGKPFLLSSDTHPPHDVVGGIGIYPPETHWMVPTNISPSPGSQCGSGWDLWIDRQLAPLVAKTLLIQHSYGHYTDGIPAAHEFPRDLALLRADACIFHRDVYQSLMTARVAPVLTRTFYHSGDLGDIIYHLPVIQRMGGGALMLGTDMGFKFPSHCREPMTPSRVALIAPLLEAQPGISKVGLHNSAIPDDWVNLNRFRETFKGNPTPNCTSLQRAALRRFGFSVQDETQPWLRPAKPDPRLKGRIVVARSPRYHNPDFPWHAIVKHHGRLITFIGLKEEHEDFCNTFGKVAYVRTDNLLEAVNVIASSRLFIGNQSCPYALAEGLKHPAILECWPHEPNCLFTRPRLLKLCTDTAQILEFIDRHQ